jgi:hypothetical protein
MPSKTFSNLCKMKKYEENKIVSMAKEDPLPGGMRTFPSQEEAERYNMIETLNKTDMEKFQLFCRMMRIGKMLSSAKIIK